MPRGETPREPKPFFWIPLSERAPQRVKPPAHDRFRDWSGRLELEIEVVSKYLYVGSGRLELFNLRGREQVYHAFARHNGQFIIPGTGIKGAVRSIAEAISNSCVRQVKKGERYSRKHEACKEEEELCPACRLFGTTGYGGRIRFSDAVPIGEVRCEIIKIADLWPPHQTRGRKFYRAGDFQRLDMKPQKGYRFIEAVPKGSKFITTLSFENVSTAEMGLLIRALGLDFGQRDPSQISCAFSVKLGGAKPRCLGAVYFRPGRLFLIPAGPDVFSALPAGGRPSPLADNLRAWLKDDSLLDKEAWEKFRRETGLEDRPCPQEVY